MKKKFFSVILSFLLVFACMTTVNVHAAGHSHEWQRTRRDVLTPGGGKWEYNGPQRRWIVECLGYYTCTTCGRERQDHFVEYGNWIPA